MNRKTIFCLQLVALLAVPCGAATLSLNSGNMTAAVLFAPDFSSYSDVDIRSDATFLLSDISGPLGIFVTSDLGNPSPNSLQLGANPTFTEGGLLTFFPAAGTLSPDKSMFTVPVVGTPFTTITDPAVAAGLGITSISFSFGGIITSGPSGNLVLYNFSSLTAGTVPEPSTISLAAAGLVALALRSIRKRR